MKIYSQLINIALLVLVLLTCWILWFTGKTAPTHNKQSPYATDAFMSQVEIKQFSTTGQVKYHMTTPQLNHIPHQNSTHMQTPHFAIYDANGTAWLITADDGQATNGNDVIHLKGHVRIHHDATKNDKETTLLTTEATYFPEKHFAQTDKNIKMLQPGTILKAKGMTADMNKSTIKLLSNVQGEYTPDA
ncbi:MAG: LPS export ABC transporter periplasmic protein LptC [Gammaproteobacteria bacterium]